MITENISCASSSDTFFFSRVGLKGANMVANHNTPCMPRRSARLVSLATLFWIAQCGAYGFGGPGPALPTRASLGLQAQVFACSPRTFALPVLHSAANGDDKRTTKSDMEKIRRIEALQKESETLANINRKRRERDAEHWASAAEAADSIAACRRLLEQAKTSSKSAQVACTQASHSVAKHFT